MFNICNILYTFPGGSDGKEFACNMGDLGLIPGLGRSPGKGTANHSSILARRRRSLADYTPWARKEPDMTERLSLNICNAYFFVQSLRIGHFPAFKKYFGFLRLNDHNEYYKCVIHQD